MASLVLSGDTSGSITLAAPAVAGSTTQTLVNVTGTLAPIVSGTAVTCAGQTSIDFTSIPSWVKRITVMLSGVSTSGTSVIQVQIGSGSVTTSGYTSAGTDCANVVATSSISTGFAISSSNAAAYAYGGSIILNLVGNNTWVASAMLAQTTSRTCFGGGNIALGGTLDRVRITTVNGTDTFDTTPSAGSINILYE